MKAALLSLRGVAKSVPATPPRLLFAGVDLDLVAGEFVAIVGESGVGKSSLLNLIAGLDRPDRGSIDLAGTDIAALGDEAATRLRRAAMGFVFQAFHILPHVTVAQNVALPLLLNAVVAPEVRTRVGAMLAAVGLAERGHSLPRELSGGELQRVAIARALVARPQLVLADEPTGNLDPDTAAQIIAVLRAQLAESGAMCLMVTHSALAAAQADRVMVLSAEGLRPRGDAQDSAS